MLTAPAQKSFIFVYSCNNRGSGGDWWWKWWRRGGDTYTVISWYKILHYIVVNHIAKMSFFFWGEGVGGWWGNHPVQLRVPGGNHCNPAHSTRKAPNTQIISAELPWHTYQRGEGKGQKYIAPGHKAKVCDYLQPIASAAPKQSWPRSHCRHGTANADLHCLNVNFA